MCHNSAHLTSSCCHWIVVKATALVVHPAAMQGTHRDLNARNAPSSAQTSKGTQLCSFIFRSRLKFGRWLISYWEQWIENDLNGSSEAKCRLSGTAVSTKNSFIDRLSPSYSLNLFSFSSFFPHLLLFLTVGIILFSKHQNRKTARHTCTYRLCHAIVTVSKEPSWGLQTVSLIVYQRGRLKPDRGVRTCRVLSVGQGHQMWTLSWPHTFSHSCCNQWLFLLYD